MLIDVDIMMIGHFTKDKIVVDGRSEIASGGAVYYGSIALRRAGVSVAVVTRLHPDDFPRLDELREAGVEVFATPAQQTSSIANIYDSTDVERRICKLLGFAGPFQSQDIPDIRAQIYFVSPVIAGEMDLLLLKSVAARGPVALDVQGFVRVRDGDELVFGDWPDVLEGLAHVTYLKADQAEAELLTGETDLTLAARQLAECGPSEIVLTQSSGVVVYADREIYTFPLTSRSLAGRTGRGDTAFASYLGKRLTASSEESCRFAAAVTTLKQENPGPWRGTLADVEALLAQRTNRSTL